MQEITRYFKPAHRDLLCDIARECEQEAGRAYLVGGCVRSALLGEPVQDFDLEVFGIAPARLESVLGKLAPVSRVGRSFGIYKLKGWPVDVGLPRSERKSGSHHRDFEIDIQPDMPLGQAALRRDFTVNAIYYDILTGKFEDPLHGVSDLECGRLRHCSDRFTEDPLRVLRAMQLAARMPARVDPATCALASTLGPEKLSRERYFAEWEKLLLAGKIPSRGLSFLKDCGWIRFFPELAALVDCPQDPQWHPEGDVWVHTLHCVDAFATQRSGDHDEDLVVGLSVLCHDMGKPLVTEISSGKIRSPGHESAGIRPARLFLDRLNVSKRLQEQVLPLVKCHMRPAMLFSDRSSPAAIRRLARDCGRLDLLLRVFRADAAGRPPMPDNSAEAIDWLTQQARELEVERSQPRPLLSGKDLLDRGWDSGPDMGRFLKAAYETQLDGGFSTRTEALAWLDAQGPGRLSTDLNHEEDP
jgi:tRNA nucleotidyltransferase (CCA-adding enzyme)